MSKKLIPVYDLAGKKHLGDLVIEVKFNDGEKMYKAPIVQEGDNGVRKAFVHTVKAYYNGYENDLIINRYFFDRKELFDALPQIELDCATKARVGYEAKLLTFDDAHLKIMGYE